jgi:hypothetical protein
MQDNKVRAENRLLQALVNNHAMLSLWGQDALVVAIDSDEYLLTSQAGRTIPQVGYKTYNKQRDR